MLRVGFVGWRGMVGSVLMQRMREEEDFAGIEPVFFSTSAPGAAGPPEAGGVPLADANDPRALAACDVVVACQGGDWTTALHPAVRALGWSGIWIDAASVLRMREDTALVLDPVNGDALRAALRSGTTTFAGANCTVSVMLMGLLGLLRSREVEWVSTMTYQAASGAGAEHVRELLAQMRVLGAAVAPTLDDPANGALEIDRAVARALPDVPMDKFGAALACSALPWIDKPMPSGQTREEWKAQPEAEKLLGFRLPVDGLCVRVGSVRCHAHGLTIKLRRPMPLDEIEGALAAAHPWVKVVPNEREATLRHLTPAAVAGTLDIAVGRVRPMTLGPGFYAAFAVGDQLLWGAAEPLRRMLRLVREHRDR